jgi:hypothetical protein
VDPPRAPSGPSGGTRSALTIAGSALLAGFALDVLLVVLLAHLSHASRVTSERDAPARVQPGREALSHLA